MGNGFIDNLGAPWVNDASGNSAYSVGSIFGDDDNGDQVMYDAYSMSKRITFKSEKSLMRYIEYEPTPPCDIYYEWSTLRTVIDKGSIKYMINNELVERLSGNALLIMINKLKTFGHEYRGIPIVKQVTKIQIKPLKPLSRGNFIEL